MKKLLPVFALLMLIVSCSSSGGEPALDSPPGWNKEIFSLPPSFAAFFPFHGREIIRFAPGWANKGQPDYWSYCFLWSLEKNPDLSTGNMEKALVSYYTGLVGSNISKRKIPAEKVIPVTAKLIPDDNGSHSWTGTVNMLDYMAQEPITLNLHIKTLAGTDADRRFLFLEVSPASPGQAIWQQMDSIPAKQH